MRKLIIFIALQGVVAFPLIAQLTDDFSDGDYVSSPSWDGDVAKFEVDGSLKLHLNAPAVSDEAYLSTFSEALADAEWRFFVEISVNPSAANFCSVYLIADQADLAADLQGYFVKIGGSADEISLYRQDGASESEIIDGLDDRVNTSPVQVEIKVNRDLAGNWTLSSRTLAETNFTVEGTAFDDTHTSGSYFGVYCKYTSTRSSAFYFDDFVVTGGPVPDVTPPVITDAQVSGDRQLLLSFSEVIDATDAETTRNYSLNGSHPSSVLYTDDTVRLTFDTAMPNGRPQELAVSGLKDLSANVMTDTTLSIVYFVPQPPAWQSILISEFLADPTPAKLYLPDESDAEFIELFNADTSPFDLEGWEINDKPLPAFILLPGEYLILCRENYRDDFSAYGQLIVPDSWPVLSNSGTSITLRSAGGALIDSLTYGTELVGDGVSAERIYVSPPCSVSENYALSKHENGATPGKLNSAFSDAKDTLAPALQSIEALSYDSILIRFDEKALAQGPWVQHIQVGHNVFPTEVNYTSADSTEILVSFESPLSRDAWHEIKINHVMDCEGNLREELVSQLYLDFDPPQISEITIRDTASLEVRFAEKLEKRSAEREGNYKLLPPEIAPRRASLTQDSLGVVLDFSQTLVSEEQYILNAWALQDLYNNTIPEDRPFQYPFHYRNDIDSLKIINAHQLDIFFSAEPDITGQVNSQFEINRSVGSPARVLKDQENKHLLHLIFSSAFRNDRAHTLWIDNLNAAEGGRLSTPLQRFFYDTRGPKITEVTARNASELFIKFDENIYDAEQEISLWINDDVVEMDSYTLAENSITIHLSNPLRAESQYEIGLAGLLDQQQNLSDPQQDFAYYFDLMPPQLDTAYFLSPHEIMLVFHEPLLEKFADDKAYVHFLAPLDIDYDLRFLKLQNNKVILSIGSQEDIQSIDLQLFKFSDLNHNLISEPITLSLQNSKPLMSHVSPLSAQRLLVQFSQAMGDIQRDDFLLNEQLPADSVFRVSEYQVLLFFHEAFKERLPYTLTYQEKTIDFTFSNYLRRLDQSGPATLNLHWTSPLDRAGAEQLENYLLNNDKHPVAAVYLPDEQMLKLIFERNFRPGVLHTLSIKNLLDVDQFRIPDAEHHFGEVIPPDQYELIISEFMADPSPGQGLAAFEYVELLNLSQRPLQMEGLVFHDKNQKKALNQYWLLPGEYLILCDEDAYPELAAQGAVMGLRSFPNLNNQEDHLQLKALSGKSIHSVAYDKSWYNDAVKRKGGWSLEMVDVAYPCRERENWAPSRDVSGGTPGKQNSVNASNPDQHPPSLRQAVAIDAQLIRLDFDEKLSEAFSPQFYVKLNNVTLNRSSLHSNQKSVFASLAEPLQSAETYELVVQYVSDCSGNIALDTQSASLVIPEKHALDDIIFSEILFQPRSGGVEFVEIYNNSDRHISLKNWKIGLQREAEVRQHLITDDVLILPPYAYLALTPEPQTLVANYPKAAEGRIFQMEAFPNLPAGGGSLLLVDDQDEIMEQVSFSPDWHHPLLREPRGVSLERISWDMDSGTPQTWQSAAATAGFATPGYQNSQWQQSSGIAEPLSADPKIFFPDQSGYQDYTRIHLKSEQAGSMLNLKIFDVQGRLIKNLVQNQSLAEDNVFVWDGTDMYRKRAKDGHYIIWAETFDLSGTVTVLKTKVVVGSRY